MGGGGEPSSHALEHIRKDDLSRRKKGGAAGITPRGHSRQTLSYAQQHATTTKISTATHSSFKIHEAFHVLKEEEHTQTRGVLSSHATAHTEGGGGRSACGLAGNGDPLGRAGSKQQWKVWFGRGGRGGGGGDNSPQGVLSKSIDAATAPTAATPSRPRLHGHAAQRERNNSCRTTHCFALLCSCV